MQFKGTLILLVIFLVLGGYVYFAEYRGQEERQRAEEAAGRALQVDQDSIREIRLSYPDRSIKAVKRDDGQWEITEPAAFEADSGEWDLLASNLTRVERSETVATENADLAAFGLDMPPVSVTATLADGGTVSLAFGNENPRGTAHYAKLGDDPAVFLTPSSYSRLFQKNLSDVRNKRLLQISTEAINSIRFVAGGNAVAFAKSEEGDWSITEPVAARADNTEVTSFLSALNLARATDFAEDSLQPAAAGLENPAMTLTLHDGEAGTDHTLLIGAASGTDMYFARNAERPVIFIINSEIPDKIRRPVFDWRDKAITRLDRDAFDALEIVSPEATIAMKKMGEDWSLNDGRMLQWEKISSMLNALDFEQARQILDRPASLGTYGLNQPRLVAIFKSGGNETLRVEFGNEAGSPEGVYLKTSENPAVMVVPKDVFDKFNVEVDDLVQNQSSSAP